MGLVWGCSRSRSLLRGYGVEDTPRWIGTSGQHETESGTSGGIDLI